METCLLVEKVDPLPEIIADTWDEPLVDAALREVHPGHGVGDPRRSTALGLTRWRLEGAADAAAVLAAADPRLPEQAPLGSASPAMDVVLAALRARLRELAPGRDVVVDRDH